MIDASRSIVRLVALALLLLPACTPAGSASPPDLAGIESSGVACEPGLCGANQVCVTLVTGFCGGAPPPCEEATDGGCPDGYTFGFCTRTGEMGCQGQCVVTGHRCIDVPAVCHPARCSCFDPDPCPVGGCVEITDGVVMCISA